MFIASAPGKGFESLRRPQQNLQSTPLIETKIHQLYLYQPRAGPSTRTELGPKF